ncbi:hypothetical protein PHYBOEH_011764 [Phytophthora boehmeriae]|uniref:Cytochrome P450 n=1 Tax=Phytophthora boehmeriae TaxID=109152 RepID=A0A8T1VHW3_9STRA|nr:hypothetical protein PHYBOEH_011764 [Phytophthora boehmeriae]
MGFISESMESRARGEKRTGGAHNIVSLILDSSDLEGEVDPQLLRSMVVAAIIAGRETSAQTLSWFIYMLSENPTWSKNYRRDVSWRRLVSL